MPSNSEILDYLRIDYADDVAIRNIEQYTKVAEAYLIGAIGVIPKNDERVKQLALFIIEDLFDRSSYTIKESSNLQKLKQSLILQLQCEAKNG